MQKSVIAVTGSIGKHAAKAPVGFKQRDFDVRRRTLRPTRNAVAQKVNGWSAGSRSELGDHAS
jgi:hypothetical protein